MKNYGYMRVSTDKQDSDNQRGAILAYTNRHSLGQIEFFGETISSRKTDRAIFQLIDRLAPDDNLVIFELSRQCQSWNQFVFRTLKRAQPFTQLVRT
ncbi:MAG: recombinase family protein [Methylococcaceae bacterium]